MSMDPQTLDEVADRLDKRAGNPVYEKAWRSAAKYIRSLKKLTSTDAKLTDKSEQISDE